MVEVNPTTDKAWLPSGAEKLLKGDWPSGESRELLTTPVCITGWSVTHKINTS